MGAASRKRKFAVAVELGIVKSDTGGRRGRAAEGNYETNVSRGDRGRDAHVKKVTPRGIKEKSTSHAAVGGGGSARLVKWLTVEEDGGLVLSGFPLIGPAVWWGAELSELLSAAPGILQDLGVDPEAIELVHDPEWTEHPEIGEAVVREGGKEVSYCLAVVQEMLIWAVGLDGKGKRREQAALLAVAVAISANLEDFKSLAELHPKFATFCGRVGINMGKMSGTGEPIADAQPKKMPCKRTKANTPKETPGIRLDLAPNQEPNEDFTDRPFWLGADALEEAQLQHMVPEGIVFRTTGKNLPNFYSVAAQELHSIVQASSLEIQYIDDPDWRQFPNVGKLVQQISGFEECQLIAFCPALQLWAVGVGSRIKSRTTAAKAAMAVALCIYKIDAGEIDRAVTEMDECLVAVIEEAMAVRDA